MKWFLFLCNKQGTDVKDQNNIKLYTHFGRGAKNGEKWGVMSIFICLGFFNLLYFVVQAPPPLVAVWERKCLTLGWRLSPRWTIKKSN